MRKILFLLALLAAAALAGACGSPGEPAAGGDPSAGGPSAQEEKPTPVQTVQVAYRETTAEQTARTSFRVTMTAAPSADPNNGGQTAPMTMSMTGEGVVDFSGAASSLTMGMAGMGAFEMRQVGNTVYMKMPREFVTRMPGAKPWMRMDLDAIYAQQYGASPVQAQGGAAQDPTRTLEYLRGVSDSVEKLGREEVRGAQTTHYRAVLNLEKEAAKQPAEVEKAYDQMVRQLGTSRLPVDVWLDEQNRVRRYALDLTAPMPQNAPAGASQNGGEVRTQMVADYYDFGTPVDVQAPPKDQTMNGSRMIPGQQQPVAR